MKTSTIKLVTLFLFAGLISACSNMEEDLFDQSASVRAEESRAHYQEVLESATEGWLFQYYPHPEQKYGGINYFVKFKNDTVTAQIEGADIEASSLYAVLNRGGSILSFNIYNPLLHYFANPSGQNPKGLEGDFEFLILAQKGDTIKLKGLRTENYMQLIKMNESFESYKKRIAEVDNFLVGASLRGNVKENEIEMQLNGSTLTFNYEKDKETVSETIAFILTDKGIDLYNPVTIQDVSAQKFILDKEKKTLTSGDGKFVINIAFTPIDLTKNEWRINIDEEKNRSQKIKEVFDLIDSEGQKKNYVDHLHPIILFGLTPDGIGISFNSVSPQSSIYRGHHGLNFGAVFENENYLKIVPGNPGFQWNYFNFYIDFVNIITNNSPYEVQADDIANPTEVKLVSSIDPDVWFVVKKAK